MKKIFLTPGPSGLYPTVSQHINDALENNICSISHRSKEFEQIFDATTSALRKLLNIPSNHHIFFTGCATEWMERIIQNCVIEKSFHFVNGSFSKKFFETAEELKKFPEKHEVAFGKGFDFDSVKIPNAAELICFTQNETSTGAMVPLDDIYSVRDACPNILIAVDIVSSAPYSALDYNKIDAAFFSVQKGFGMPSGLGVLILNERCIEKAGKISGNGLSIGSYHSIPSLLKKEAVRQTPETPNVLGIYVLGKVCEDMLERGIENIRAETEKKADFLYGFFEKHEMYELFVSNKRARSKTVIAVNTPEGSAKVIKKLMGNGLFVGTGYGDYKEIQIRIANFPAHGMEDIEKLINLLTF